MTKDLLTRLRRASTATYSTILLKKGLRSCYIDRAMPLNNNYGRIVGRAFTLRFIPMREDKATPASWGNPISTRAAIEAMEGEVIAIAGTNGVQNSGCLGDILCSRMKMRGVQAFITDGMVRDIEGIEQTKLPIWANGTVAPSSVAGLTFVGWQEPIGVGGAAIFPNDYLIADRDGVIVIPQEIADEIADLALEQENQEAWILNEVQNGVALPGLYPMNDATKLRYNEFVKNKQ